MAFLILAALLYAGYRLCLSRFATLQKSGHLFLVLASVLTVTTLRMHVAQAKPLTFGELPQKTITLPRPGKAPQKAAPVGYDLDKLAHAVATAETGGCTLGSGKTHHNAYGIMVWPNGHRQFKRYSSCEESVKDFKRIWAAYYKRFPDLNLARRWTGNDRASTWLATVTRTYNAL